MADAFLDGVIADDIYLVLIGDILVFLIQLSSDSLSCRAVDVSASESLCPLHGTEDGLVNYDAGEK